MEIFGIPWNFTELHEISWNSWNSMISSDIQCLHRNDIFGWITLENNIWITNVSAKSENWLDGMGVWRPCLSLCKRRGVRWNFVKATFDSVVFAPHAEPSQIIKETTGCTQFWEPQFSQKRNFHEFLIKSIKTEITKGFIFTRKRSISQKHIEFHDFAILDPSNH